MACKGVQGLHESAECELSLRCVNKYPPKRGRKGVLRVVKLSGER